MYYYDMYYLMIGLSALAVLGLCLAWIVLKIVSLAMRSSHVNRITGEISRAYFGTNIAARIMAVCGLGLIGLIFTMGIIFEPSATPGIREDTVGLLIMGIIFFGIAVFRLIFLFRFIWKYRLNENGHMMPVHMQLFMEHLQKQESNIIRSQEIEQKFNGHLQEQALVYKIEPDINDLQAIEQEFLYKTETDIIQQQETDNKSNTSLLESSLTSDSLINTPQTSNIFKDGGKK